ncbi:MAG: bifunctional 4-hydroxy-2-oxoglutarate aldolase/2-dehydro-3-deoxy-phosphogluconate aldolase [Phycisphaeraceae bacterium]
MTETIEVEQRVEQILTNGLIAVIRSDSADTAVNISRTLHKGGVRVLEIALTTPGGRDAIKAVKQEFGDDAVVGAGTVLSSEAAEDVIAAGADFVFAPNTDVDVIRTVKRLNRPMVPGALTPTEVATAMAAGADIIKLFPGNVFGPKYIRDLRGPYPGVRITPTGGVSLENIGEWFEAGAVAVGIGTAMIQKDLVREKRWDALSEVAAKYVAAVRQARG